MVGAHFAFAASPPWLFFVFAFAAALNPGLYVRIIAVFATFTLFVVVL
jgi:hypothetical protein